MTAQNDDSRISHYLVIGELGRDGLGVVLSAVDEMLDRPVALKVVRTVDAYPADVAAEARQRFTRNAQRAARVVHPNVVTIYGYEQIGDADVLAMELVEGETLQARLARGERWRALDAAALVARIADGLAAAHARYLVHGHVGLRNVKLRPDGRVKILDLGVPKVRPAELAAYVSAAAAGEAPVTVDPTFAQDVAALARIACHLVTGALRAAAEGTPSPAARVRQPMFPDPARVLPNLGVLAPVLARALTPAPGEAFADASAFRDSLLEVLETSRRSDDARVHPVASPVIPGRSPGTRGGVILEAEGRLATLDGFAGETRRPALVLPPDLAANVHAPAPGSFVVMSNARPLDRMRAATARVLSRAPRGTIIAALALVLLLTATGIALRLRLGDASAATVEGGEEAVASAPAPLAPVAASIPAPPMPDDAVEQMVATLDSVAAAMPPVRTGQVAARPAGTAITLVGGEGGPWLDAVELSVKDGDSLVLRFVRPGYVARTAVFRGAPLDLTLQPDSVIVRFDANVPADVYLFSNDGEPRLLGTTDLAARLPTGAHRLVFRAAHQDDWLVTRRFQTAGDTYTVSKTDYATTGDLVATAIGGWAWVSLDGGEEHETPHRFPGLTLGPHVLRLRQDGFRTIVDTVDVRGGQALTRRYTLQRNP